MIATLPTPVAEMLTKEFRLIPLEFAPVAHEVPLTMSEPELLATVDPLA